MNPVHVHLFLNHVPLIGLLFAIVFLITGLSRRSEQTVRTSLIICSAIGVIAIPVALSGLASADALEGAGWLNADALTEHRLAGIITLVLLVGLGAICGAVLLRSRRRSTVPASAKWVVTGLAIAGSGASAGTAYLGGALRHSELRRAYPGPDERAHMPFDEPTQRLLKQMAGANTKSPHEWEPAELRAANAAFRWRFGTGPDMARVEDARVHTTSGDFDVRVLVPPGVVRGLFLWYHGGGWVAGSIESSDTLGRLLAAEIHCAVVLVGYRLAPEHPFPTAADDAYAALEWSAQNAQRIAGKAVPLVVGGDSAGGNLAAVTSRRARDRRGPPIALQVLVVPVTDANFETASYLAPENQVGVWTRDAERWFWHQYVPRVSDRGRPDASPLRATQFANLAPAVILTAEYDVLRDEGEAYAEQLRQAAVPVKHRRFLGQVHGFFVMVNILPGSAVGRAFLVDAIADRFANLDRLHNVGGEDQREAWQ